MDKRFRILLLLLSFGIGMAYAQDVKQKKVVIIDPGHGGMDSGAVSKNGLQEKEVVLAVAKAILHLNQDLFDNEYDIYLTRYRDTLVSLSDRTKLGRVFQPDIMISLHCNHANTGIAKGVEVYIHTSNNGKTEIHYQEINIATTFLNTMRDQLGFLSRGVKKANFQVLRDAKYKYPSILVEFGFLSNQLESKYLQSEMAINALALTVLTSIRAEEQ